MRPSRFIGAAFYCIAVTGLATGHRLLMLRRFIIIETICLGLAMLEFLELPVKERDAFKSGLVADLVDALVRLYQQPARPIDLVLI